MSKDQKPKKNLGIHLFAGGVAGCCEALTCHPLDTIKVRLQLRGEQAARRPITTMAGQAMNAAAAELAKVVTFAAIRCLSIGVLKIALL